MAQPTFGLEQGPIPHEAEVRLRKTIQKWAGLAIIAGALITGAAGFAGQWFGARTQRNVAAQQLREQDKVFHGQIAEQHKNFEDEQLASAYTNYLNSTEGFQQSSSRLESMLVSSSIDGKHFQRVGIATFVAIQNDLNVEYYDIQTKWGIVSLLAPPNVVNACKPDFDTLGILPSDLGDLVRALKLSGSLTDSQYSEIVRAFLDEVDQDNQLETIIGKALGTAGNQKTCSSLMRASIGH